jgi:sortase B
MKKRKLKKSVKIVFTFLFLVIALSVFFFLRHLDLQPDQPEVPETAETPVPRKMSEKASLVKFEFVPEEDPPEYYFDEERIQTLRNTFAEDHSINNDVKAILVFQSGLVEQPVLRGTDNDHYLYCDWTNHQYRSWGSIMMECEDVFPEEEQNTSIYGHYVYPIRTPDRTVMFTPLALLMKQENYEENKYLAMVTDEEIRYYEIASVVNIALVDHDYLPSDMEYSISNFDEDYFENYMKRVEEREYYDTGIDISYEDHMLTLQTCIENYPENRELVLCRELERIQFE